MRKLFITLTCLFVATILIGGESDIVLKTTTGDINGSLLTPDNDAKNIIALFICGSGPTDRNGNNPQMINNSIKCLADDLCREGIASVRYDKRGIASSAMAGLKEEDLRFSSYVDDAKAWVGMLAKEYKKVVIIGHSEGSLIGILATSGNPQVAGLVSLAGVGSSADKLLKSQLSAQPKEVAEIAFPIIDSLKSGRIVENFPPMFNALFRGSVQPYLISWFAIEPTAEMKKIGVPVLIVQGDMDIQVSVADAELLHNAQPKAKKVIIPNMNHVFKACATTDQSAHIQTYINPDLKNVPQLSTEVIDFIRRIK